MPLTLCFWLGEVWSARSKARPNHETGLAACTYRQSPELKGLVVRCVAFCKNHNLVRCD